MRKQKLKHVVYGKNYPSDKACAKANKGLYKSLTGMTVIADRGERK